MYTEAYSEPCRTSKMGLFVKIVNSFQPFTISAKSFILDVRLGSENDSGLHRYYLYYFIAVKIINSFMTEVPNV